MSKAFTKEDDGGDDIRPVAAWPSGVRNYLTPAGHAALKAELEALLEAPRGDGRQRLAVEQRQAALLARLEAAEVVDPATQPRDVVRFGATVTVEGEDGRRRSYRIVGVDEADPKRGWVSWRAPIARALVGRRVGDTTQLRTPTETEDIIVRSIDYTH